MNNKCIFCDSIVVSDIITKYNYNKLRCCNRNCNFAKVIIGEHIFSWEKRAILNNNKFRLSTYKVYNTTSISKYNSINDLFINSDNSIISINQFIELPNTIKEFNKLFNHLFELRMY